MEILKLKPVKAYTIYSSDNEYTSSPKGCYRDYNIASIKAVGSGWYGLNGTVKSLDDIYQDENGELYNVKKIGKFTDEEENYKEQLLENVKSKLTKEELEFLNIK